MENNPKTTHPLILAAAGSVIIASLAAAAHFTGLLPSHGSEPPSPAPTVTAAAPAATPVPAPAAAPQPAPAAQAPMQAEAAKPVAKPHPPRTSEPARHVSRGVEDRRYEDKRDDGNRRVSTNNAGIDVIPSSPPPVAAATPTPAAPPVCHDCGTVESVREVATQGEGTGLGAVAGGLLGGVLGHQVGRGSGRDLATIAGAVGGAVAGHQVEKNVRTGRQYQVTVRFDDGAVRSYAQENTAWHTGDRVRLANGSLAPIGTPER